MRLDEFYLQINASHGERVTILEGMAVIVWSKRSAVNGCSVGGTQILVGPENIAKELKDTSVVMTRFDIGDGMQGLIGVVGSTRMDYAQVTARLSYFAENLGRMFSRPELPPTEHNEPGDD